MATFTSTTSLNSHRRREYAPIGVLELSNNNNNNNAGTFSPPPSSSPSASLPFSSSSSVNSVPARLRSAASNIPGRAVVVVLAVVLLFVASFGLTPRIAAGKVPPIGFPATHAVAAVDAPPVAPPSDVHHAFSGDVTAAVGVRAPIVRACPTRVASCACTATHPAVVVKATAIVNEGRACSCAFDVAMHNSKAFANGTPVKWSMQLTCTAVERASPFGHAVSHSIVTG